MAILLKRGGRMYFDLPDNKEISKYNGVYVHLREKYDIPITITGKVEYAHQNNKEVIIKTVEQCAHFNAEDIIAIQFV